MAPQTRATFQRRASDSSSRSYLRRRRRYGIQKYFVHRTGLLSSNPFHIASRDVNTSEKIYRSHRLRRSLLLFLLLPSTRRFVRKPVRFIRHRRLARLASSAPAHDAVFSFTPHSILLLPDELCFRALAGRCVPNNSNNNNNN